jgi:mutator protein MutT
MRRGPDVVVAMIENINRPDYFLVQYRDFDPILKPEKYYPGRLEFPGGKVDSTDGSGDLKEISALIREVQEEIGLEIKNPSFLCTIDYKFPSGLFHNVHFYVVTEYSGEPVGNEGQRYGWVTLYQLMTYPKCLPLNRAAALILTTEMNPDFLVD